MKTISGRFNRNHRYYQNCDQAEGDMNKNATITQVEYERNACEEELYRLRYGIEQLLANNQQGDYKQQHRQRSRPVQDPFRRMTDRTPDFNNRENESSIDRYTSCCRHLAKNRYDDNFNIRNEYTDRPVYNDRNYDDLPLHRTPDSSLQSQQFSDSFVSASPSPSISSRYIDPNMSHTKNDLRRSIDTLVNRDTYIKRDVSDLLTSKDINDPVYNALILKILEAKALDCLCTGYSKQNTQKQIAQALAQLNQRVDEHQWDSVSATSSPSSYESSSASSVLTNDESISSGFITPQLYSPSSSVIQTPNTDQTTSTLISPDHNKDKMKKFNENIKSPKKKSKVTILADKTSRASKAKRQKKSSSKHRKKPTKTSTHRSKSTKTPTPQKKSTKTPTHRSRSKTPIKKSRSSSKLKSKKVSSKSPSRSKSSKKHTSKHSKSIRTKPKSNNQINDHETVILPTFIYPQSYQEIYRNRQRFLKLLLSST